MIRQLTFSLLAAAALLQAAPAVPNPVVSGPVTGGTRGGAFGAWGSGSIPAGYIEEERFVSGTASFYTKSGEWGADGKWTATATDGVRPYKVRMLVRRPSDPARFNGVLVMEWLNVTAQSEGAADFMQMQEELIREGYAWAGIGAQAVGINAPGTGLKAWDPERYGTLLHPGDAYSYDIYSQAAQALRHPRDVDPLGGLRVRHMIATGARNRRSGSSPTSTPSTRSPGCSTASSSTAAAATRREWRPRRWRATAIGRFLPAPGFAPTSTCRCSTCRPKAT